VTHTPFPFSAVVGHQNMRLALLLTAVAPAIGGVLVRGEKGTAKSTVVRALARLLPPRVAVLGCRFACEPTRPDPECPDGPHSISAGVTRLPCPLVELPLGATEDRLIGSLDPQRALSEGVLAYQPGLLAAAHRGLLYVDEVNLLPDHLVDLLLDAAAMSRAHVQRDGVALSHAASFLLVGTMNPEEGELRPQLLDRFGLTVEVRASREVDQRVEVIRRRLAYEADPVAFAEAWRADEERLASRVAAARELLPRVTLPDAELRRIASVCAAFEVDGMRADLVTARTAVAHAAWRGAAEVAESDVRVAARLALPHRRRRDPFDEPGLDQAALDDALDKARSETGPAPPRDRPGDGPDGPPDGLADGGAPTLSEQPRDGRPSPGGDGDSRPAPTPAPGFRPRLLTVPGVGEGAPGRRSTARTGRGRLVRATAQPGVRAADLHLPATVLAAVPHQRARGHHGPLLAVWHDDLRFAVREGRESNLVLFVVDASGSMAARRRMAAVSGAVVSLLRDAYQRRDQVGLVSFRAGGAELLLPPTTSVPTAVTRLSQLRTGGRTPLAGGLLTARRVLAVARLREPTRRPLMVLLTDGRATVPLRPGGEPVADALRAAASLGATGAASVVVDCEAGPVRLGLAARLAAAAGATLVEVGELSADRVAGVVRAGLAAR